MQVLAVALEFAGEPVDVSGTWLLGFVGFVLLLVAVPLCFNMTNHGANYIDEYWGDGSIDDDDWGLAIAEARIAAARQHAELAERSEARQLRE